MNDLFYPLRFPLVKHTWRARLIALSLFALINLLVGFATAYSVKKNTLQQLKQETSFHLANLESTLVSTLEQHKHLPEILSHNPNLQQFMLQNAPIMQQLSINRYLAKIVQAAHVQDIYLTNTQGITVAASNWDQGEGSFIGKDFSWRPYFHKAITGVASQYYALGTTSGKRGYYFAYPVPNKEKVSGVIVVKSNIELFTNEWSKNHIDYHIEFLITDPNGIIFMSSMPNWVWHSLKPLSSAQQQILQQSRRYHDLNAFPILSFRQENEIWHTDKNASYLHQSRPMRLDQDEYWDVHILLSTQPLNTNLNTTIWLNLILTTLLALLAYTIWYNITQRRHYERQEKRQLTDEVERRTRQLKQTQEELVQAAKMAALGQLSSGINHEINNPLAAIRAYADNATQFLQLNRYDMVQSNLTEIGKLTERIATITRQLKAFSRKSHGNISTCQVQQAFESARLIVSPKLNQIQLDISCSADAYVEADLVWLEQILVNLLSNAIEATQDQNSARVCFTCQAYTDHAGNTWLDLQIHDNGAGISAEAMPQIFEAFFTTKAIGKGLGLGLSISYRLARDMGGELRASNHPDGGAVFTLTLKATDGAIKP